MSINSYETGQDEAEKADEKILAEAQARFKLEEEINGLNRRLAKEDLEFKAGDQWPSDVKNQREQDGRPCLTINKIPQFSQQITNDQRQNRPSIKVHPVDDNADIETAKVISGLIRHIETNSNAEAAYDTAFESAVDCGFGYWRIVTQFLSPLSFDQEILIKRIPDRFSVRLDPNHQEPDGSDAEWGFIFETISKDEYKSKYGETKLAQAQSSDWANVGVAGWVQSDSCLVAEYFYKAYETKTLCLLSSGEVVLKDDLEKFAQSGMQVEVLKERETSVPVIKWCKLNGVEILEKTDWPGMYIPIVPVYGSEENIDGKRTFKGIIRNAKDSARMYNFWASAETEAIALAPRAPFIAAVGQIEGFEEIWETANRANHSVLPYNPKEVGGSLLPPLQRNAIEPAVQAITQARMLSSDDLKATTGIYDAALGAKSNESSGIAIQRRNVQAQTSNFHFIDNLTRSLRHTGRILIDLIPKIYDTARTARIIGDDGEQKVIKVNQPFEQDGKQVLYALDAGKYDVVVDVGPSFATKRQEAAASMLDLTKAMPQLLQVAGDLLVKNMDWPGASDIAERLKKTIPPNLLDDPSKKQNAIPPQVQAQMQQMNQMVEQLTNKVHELQDEKEQKLIELESRERIEFKKLEVQLEIKRAELDAKDSHLLLSNEIDQINQRLNMLQINQPIAFEEEQQEQFQNFNPNDADGGNAMSQMDEQEPTGGISPGQPIEGNSNEYE